MNGFHSINDQNLELGQLYADRIEFDKAIAVLILAAKGFQEEKEFNKFLECQCLLLRIYAEREQHEDIIRIKELLQDLVLNEGLELSAKTYYTLGLCAGYKGQPETAMEYFQKSLAIALAHDNKKDICYAINGIAISYKDLGKVQEALKEIYNLQVFFQVIEIPEIKMSSQVFNASIMMELKKFDQAIELLWSAYEDLKTRKAFYAQGWLLFQLGRAYSLSGDKESGRTYLNMAAKLVDPVNMVRLHKLVQAELSQHSLDSKHSFDLVFQLEEHTVVEKKLGKVDFKNQFILLDLLRLFCQNQGQVYSKEFLVEHVWKQSYDPSVHDNKIYVTIKRLRKLIEPDFDKPKYIFRAKNGYFMNKSAKILLEKNEEGMTQ
jgi:tetratricopeptide (TPR) repeat protein